VCVIVWVGIEVKLTVVGVGMGGVEPLERRKTISSIRDENLGASEKPDFISLKGTLIYMKHGMYVE